MFRNFLYLCNVNITKVAKTMKTTNLTLTNGEVEDFINNAQQVTALVTPYDDNFTHEGIWGEVWDNEEERCIEFKFNIYGCINSKNEYVVTDFSIETAFMCGEDKNIFLSDEQVEMLEAYIKCFLDVDEYSSWNDKRTANYPRKQYKRA